MKSALIIVLSICLFCGRPAPASVIYFDNFDQFPNGTVLTQTNYFPNLGLNAEIDTNDNSGVNSTTVVASNFLGSTRAFFNLGTLPYQHEYRGDQIGGTLTNQLIVLSFKLWVEATKSATHVGGVGVNLVTVDTNQDANPLIFINDGGQVFTFTNNPAPPVLNNVVIGNWGTLAGHFMTNVLTVNYPAGTYTFSINGTVLTNGPIPSFLSNIFTRVRIEVFEGISGAGTLNSLGNRFALDDVQLTSGAASTNRDVRNYIAAAKGQSFNQLSAGAPTISATGFLFHADVVGVDTASVVSASVQVPGGATKTLLRSDPGNSELEFNDAFTTKIGLDNTYQSNGTYTMSVDTSDQGAFVPALNLSADNYPNTPQVSNFTAAQSVNSTTNFIVTWNVFTGGSSLDFITLSVDDSLGNTAFSTPDIGDVGALDGTATSVVITGGMLQVGMTYTGRVLFVKRTTTDTNSIPGALGLAGFFTQTEFPIITLAGAGAICSLTPPLATNDVGATHTVTATVTTNGIPAVGVTVNFDVISGPNVGASSNNVTDGGGQASFSYSSITTGTDTIQASGTISSMSFTCTATEVWLLPNVPPVAVCQDVTNAANSSCQANVSAAQVDHGSFDSDGVIVSRTLRPPGPYALGVTPVTLTVVDDRGGSNSCVATITVIDQTPPTITCPSSITTNIPFGQSSVVVNYPAPTVSDNCSVAITNNTPPSGSSFAPGTNQVTCTAVDGAGNTNSCTFNVIVTQAPPSADLALIKVASPNPVFFGSNLTYTITVTNRGPNDAASVTITDALPSRVTFVSAGASQGSCTQIAGTVTCDLGTVANGSTATVSVVVIASHQGIVTNRASVTSVTTDPLSSNNTGSAVTAVAVHDFAVVALKVPKTITLSATKSNQTKSVRVTIQSRSPVPETIADATTLNNLVTLALTSLHTNSTCQAPVAVLHAGRPQRPLPVTLKPKQKFTVIFDVTYTCATDPLKTTRTDPGHDDYSYTATVHAGAINGEADADPLDDNCPHNALPGGVDQFPDGKVKDTGCGGRNPDHTLGAPVTTDVIVK